MAMRPRRSGDTAMPAAQPVFEDFKPTATWQEDNENHVIAIDLPDFVKEEIRVRTETQNIIRVSGDRSVTRNRRRRFQEDFRVPENGEINSIRAKLKGGILTITIPKKIVDMSPKVALPSRAETPPTHNLPAKPASQPSPEVPGPPTPQKAQDKATPAVGASQPTDEKILKTPTAGDSGMKGDQTDDQRHGRSGTPFKDAGRVLPWDLEIGELKGRPVTEEMQEKTSRVSQELADAGTAVKPKLDIHDGAAAT